MNTRKRRSDRNHIIYVITSKRTGQFYIGLTAVNYNGNIARTLLRRYQKHVQRALTETKDWGLCKAIRKFGADGFTISKLEVVRGKAQAHVRETQLINTLKPKLNTFGVK